MPTYRDFNRGVSSFKNSNTRITAQKIGPWKLAGSKIHDYATTVPEVEAIIRGLAEDSAARLKRNIRNGIYSDWPELSQATKERKARLGQSMNALIATGDYVDAIEVMDMGPGLWAIGIESDARHSEDGDSLAMIGLAHEYGTATMPPRPHWRREYIVFAGQVTKAVNAWLKTKS